MNSQKYILNSIKLEDEDFTADAYVGSIVHFIGSCSVAFFTSSIVNKIGPRPTMIIAAALQLLYVAQFLFLINWLFYLGNFVRGVGAGIIWTAQGRFLTQNSTKQTITKNASIFTWIIATNRIVGNVYIYFRFTSEVISKSHRQEIYGIMTLFTVFTVVIFSCLQKAKYNQPVKQNFILSLKTMFKLFCEPRIWFMVPSMMFLSMNFSLSSIHCNSVGFTETMSADTAMRKISLCGIVFGIGGLLCGLTLTGIDNKIKKSYYFYIIIFGFSTSLLSNILVFINLPNSSSHGATMEPGLIPSNLPIALIASTLYGFGDACFFQQAYAMSGILLKQKIAHAHGIFRFFIGFSAIITFTLATFIGLYVAICVVSLVGIIAVVCFCTAEIKYKNQISGEDEFVEDNEDDENNVKDRES